MRTVESLLYFAWRLYRCGLAAYLYITSLWDARLHPAVQRACDCSCCAVYITNIQRFACVTCRRRLLVGGCVNHKIPTSRNMAKRATIKLRFTSLWNWKVHHSHSRSYKVWPLAGLHTDCVWKLLLWQILNKWIASAWTSSLFFLTVH